MLNSKILKKTLERKMNFLEKKNKEKIREIGFIAVAAALLLTLGLPL